MPAGAGAGSATAPEVGAAPGGLDAIALRRSWDDVLAHLQAVKKTAWVQLTNAQVVSVEGRTVTLSFAHAGTMKGFQGGVSPEFLRDALKEVLGADLQVVCVLADAAAAAGTSAAVRRGAPAAPQNSPTDTGYDGFAPGDEAEPEDPDAPRPPDRVVGEDAALDLVRSQLGGTVLGSTGEV